MRQPSILVMRINW